MCVCKLKLIFVQSVYNVGIFQADNLTPNRFITKTTTNSHFLLLTHSICGDGLAQLLATLVRSTKLLYAGSG